jgi:hypothetical protein
LPSQATYLDQIETCNKNQMSKQLVIDGLPKSRGGVRDGSGRKKTAIDTKTIRVSAGVADACKRLDENYRAMLATPETEESILISLGKDSMIVTTTAEERLIADRLVEELLTGPLSDYTTAQKKSFLALLLVRLFEKCETFEVGNDAKYARTGI